MTRLTLIAAFNPRAAFYLYAANGATNNLVVQNKIKKEGQGLNFGSALAAGFIGATFGKLGDVAAKASTFFAPEFAQIGWNSLTNVTTTIVTFLLPGPKNPAVNDGYCSKIECAGK